MKLTTVIASAALLAASTSSQAGQEPINKGVGESNVNSSASAGQHAKVSGYGYGHPCGYAPYSVPAPYYGSAYGVPGVAPQLSEEQKAALEAQQKAQQAAMKAQRESFLKAVEAQQEAFRKATEAQQKALQAAAEKGELMGPASPVPFANPSFGDPLVANPLFADLRGPVHSNLFSRLDEQHNAILESQMQAMEQQRAALDKRLEDQHQRFNRRFAEFSPRFQPILSDTNPPVDTQQD